jgi:hypothetical protein
MTVQLASPLSLVLISVRSVEDLATWYNSITTSGVEPATFMLVAVPFHAITSQIIVICMVPTFLLILKLAFWRLSKVLNTCTTYLQLIALNSSALKQSNSYRPKKHFLLTPVMCLPITNLRSLPSASVLCSALNWTSSHTDQLTRPIAPSALALYGCHP